jgi:hypothetical protein
MLLWADRVDVFAHGADEWIQMKEKTSEFSKHWTSVNLFGSFTCQTAMAGQVLRLLQTDTDTQVSVRPVFSSAATSQTRVWSVQSTQISAGRHMLSHFQFITARSEYDYMLFQQQNMGFYVREGSWKRKPEFRPIALNGNQVKANVQWTIRRIYKQRHWRLLGGQANICADVYLSNILAIANANLLVLLFILSVHNMFRPLRAILR